MLWLRKGFGLAGGWTVNDQNDWLTHLFGLRKVKSIKAGTIGVILTWKKVCSRPVSRIVSQYQQNHRE